jgi:hypothetical protein
MTMMTSMVIPARPPPGVIPHLGPNDEGLGLRVDDEGPVAALGRLGHGRHRARQQQDVAVQRVLALSGPHQGEERSNEIDGHTKGSVDRGAISDMPHPRYTSHGR